MENIVILSVGLKSGHRGSIEYSLQELKSLVRTAGGKVSETFYQMRDKYVPATLIGKGKLNRIKEELSDKKVDLIVFDNQLSPTQLRNIEKALDCRVIDRIQLILDIFALHATTREGKLQVELAQLQYMLPRIRGLGMEMSRLGGGIGTRGPGETKLEVKRRKIRQRITRLKKDLEKVEKQRQVQRKRRMDNPIPIVSVIGYTNSGKSTLLKNLSNDKKIKVRDELFATLSPVSREVYLKHSRKAIFNDTVGFIKNLPHTIVESFKATLEEILFSDLIVHLVDVSDPNRDDKKRESEKVLKEINADEIQRIVVFNKIDLLDENRLETLKQAHPEAVFVSAESKEGFEKLRDRVYDSVFLRTCSL